MNLLTETIGDICSSGHTPEDIIFIGSENSGHRCTWEEFRLLADIEYDSGFGGQEIATDLIIVFKDGVKMWRHEYDGSENWDYSTPFTEPKITRGISRLKIDNGRSGWHSLSEMNGGE